MDIMGGYLVLAQKNFLIKFQETIDKSDNIFI